MGTVRRAQMKVYELEFLSEIKELDKDVKPIYLMHRDVHSRVSYEEVYRWLSTRSL